MLTKERHRMKTCQEITESIEKANFNRLSVKERLAIRFHLSMCKHCRQYSKDSKIIDRMLKNKFKSVNNFTFSVKEKEDLKKKMG